MDKKRSKYRTMIDVKLPDGLEDMSIGDLIRDKDSEIHIRNGKISIRRVSKDSIAYFEFTTYETRKLGDLHSSSAKLKKSDYANHIRSMLTQGMAQKDIAFELGISPAYVSKIVNGK